MNLQRMVAIAAFTVCGAGCPALGAGLLVKLQSVTNLTLYCDSDFRKCKPANIEPVDANWPVRVYRLFRDGVYKYKDGQMYRCLVGKWAHYRLSDDDYYSCSARAVEGAIVLYERFGPRNQDAYNIELQISSFSFKSLDCVTLARQYEDGNWVERRRDLRCWKAE